MLTAFPSAADSDGDGLSDAFEAAFGGNIDINNPETGGTGTASCSSGGGLTIITGSVTVTFPPGTTVGTQGNDLTIQFIPGSTPKLKITNAVLPPGTTKTVDLPVGGTTTVCIADSKNASVTLVDNTSCPPAPPLPGCPSAKVGVSMPALGDSVVISTKTPTPECLDATYKITRISTTHVRIEGMVHTAMGMSPWGHLGKGLAGSVGVPVLAGNGSFAANAQIDLSLSGALPVTSAWLAAGISKLNASFKGGTLIPNVDPPGFLAPLTTSQTGDVDVGSRWPPGVPLGFQVYFQVWVQDPGGPFGFSASNGLSGTVP